MSNNKKSIQELNKQEAPFMWFQLLIEILLNMQTLDSPNKELMAECRLQYVDNTSELNKIDEFDKEYPPDKAVG
ncbi:unnamed protein product [Didymodactylos carnosus]|uniref:Uncharacterized protein n=1 Tax=Didymodactylos carnosus TaxID=1234261 RepID=A0A814T9R8_9BILA|nr:unnamed protein product [Didymodactylos carnosus]CAF1155401.1 unnamed protein product [Didymodactylos carnosus]CAF3592673.1 unnamed protein product [Didymodactylos carnosus]CAF3918842.1 unnamed protein product [Didymodactylos carnosus]